MTATKFPARTLRPLFLIIASCTALVSGLIGGPVTIESLLMEMVNRDGLARFPEPAFTARQFSSYDRATVAKEAPGWFANSDRSMFLRVEKERGRREFVMMDAAGPGAVVRFWMTFSGKDSGQGIMRVYLDGNPVPVIAGAAFDILSGNLVAEAPLAASVSEATTYRKRGHNLYFPIPYARHCKITYESGNLREDDFGAKQPGTEAVYYNINYRTYGGAVEVVSYSQEEMRRHRDVIAAVRKQLTANEPVLAPQRGSLRLDATLQPGESRTSGLAGPAAIQHLAMRLVAGNQAQALRSTVIGIAFDGEKTVWVPVGDFFGVGYQQVATRTWYTSADEDGLMQASWVMPFAKDCAITVSNLGNQSVRLVDASVNVKAWTWDDRSMHFGAGWRQYTRIMAGPYDQAVDVNFASLEGKGVFVGDGVALFNTGYSWWGEGDEKIYIDGESFPSHLGTGTEDYYGYAWCRPEAFTGHPFIAQPVGTGNFSPRYTVNARLRALDAIPFTRSIHFDMELWAWLRARVNYAPVAFWYMMPGGHSLAPADVAGVKEPVVLDRAQIYSPELASNREGLGIEGECLLWTSTPSGQVSYQALGGMPSGDGLQLSWKDIEVGNRAGFSFHSHHEGRFALTGVFATAPDHGVFNIYLNGKRIFRHLDLGAAAPVIKEAKADAVDLVQGTNLLEVELVRHAKDARRSQFGLDKLKLSGLPAGVRR